MKTYVILQNYSSSKAVKEQEVAISQAIAFLIETERYCDRFYFLRDLPI